VTSLLSLILYAPLRKERRSPSLFFLSLLVPAPQPSTPCMRTLVFFCHGSARVLSPCLSSSGSTSTSLASSFSFGLASTCRRVTFGAEPTRISDEDALFVPRVNALFLRSRTRPCFLFCVRVPRGESPLEVLFLPLDMLSTSETAALR